MYVRVCVCIYSVCVCVCVVLVAVIVTSVASACVVFGCVGGIRVWIVFVMYTLGKKHVFMHIYKQLLVIFNMMLACIFRSLLCPRIYLWLDRGKLFILGKKCNFTFIQICITQVLYECPFVISIKQVYV